MIPVGYIYAIRARKTGVGIGWGEEISLSEVWGDKLSHFPRIFSELFFLFYFFFFYLFNHSSYEFVSVTICFNPTVSTLHEVFFEEFVVC